MPRGGFGHRPEPEHTAVAVRRHLRAEGEKVHGRMPLCLGVCRPRPCENAKPSRFRGSVWYSRRVDRSIQSDLRGRVSNCVLRKCVFTQLGQLPPPRGSVRITGGFNPSTQHTKRRCGGRSVADEEKTAHLLLGHQRALIWERWRKGETLHQIARLFDRHHSSVQRIVAESGGIRPTERRRSRSALTLIEREEISRGVVARKSVRAIAATLRLE